MIKSKRHVTKATMIEQFATVLTALSNSFYNLFKCFSKKKDNQRKTPNMDGVERQ